MGKAEAFVKFKRSEIGKAETFIDYQRSEMRKGRNVPERILRREEGGRRSEERGGKRGEDKGTIV